MAFNQTVLGILDPIVDHREASALPILTELERRAFTKNAISDIPGAHAVFNKIFGGTRKANDYPTQKLPDCGVPTFLWAGK